MWLTRREHVLAWSGVKNPKRYKLPFSTQHQFSYAYDQDPGTTTDSEVEKKDRLNDDRHFEEDVRTSTYVYDEDISFSDKKSIEITAPDDQDPGTTTVSKIEKEYGLNDDRFFEEDVRTSISFYDLDIGTTTSVFDVDIGKSTSFSDKNSIEITAPKADEILWACCGEPPDQEPCSIIYCSQNGWESFDSNTGTGDHESFK